MEEEIDKKVEKMRNTNIKRLGKGKCQVTQGSYFSEILVDLERVGDHCLNIAKLVKKYPITKE
jgi:phosphate:Na+ symporter